MAYLAYPVPPPLHIFYYYGTEFLFTIYIKHKKYTIMQNAFGRVRNYDNTVHYEARRGSWSSGHSKET